MDQQLIAQKLESLRRSVERVELRVPADVNLLTQDVDAQDILVLNLTRAVQLCVDIASHLISGSSEPAPATMGESFDALCRLGILSPALAARMKKSVGFRNVAVHNYEAINWAIVFAICTKNLVDFKDFARAVVEHCEL